MRELKKEKFNRSPILSLDYHLSAALVGILERAFSDICFVCS